MGQLNMADSSLRAYHYTVWACIPPVIAFIAKKIPFASLFGSRGIVNILTEVSILSSSRGICVGDSRAKSNTTYISVYTIYTNGVVVEVCNRSVMGQRRS